MNSSPNQRVIQCKNLDRYALIRTEMHNIYSMHIKYLWNEDNKMELIWYYINSVSITNQKGSLSTFIYVGLFDVV